ncbi:hypothetical protein JG688_00004028 [Phytophthora aleatoria]|uniref:Uncharacterized protein n=1 Tax=Phytophthora aleatoria TaxID=2496075 RepID=A0A8J5IRT4_9STRA|nr:hypothetical protein JG688_00004028 [Phytophthora aleatoria]
MISSINTLKVIGWKPQTINASVEDNPEGVRRRLRPPQPDVKAALDGIVQSVEQNAETKAEPVTEQTSEKAEEPEQPTDDQQMARNALIKIFEIYPVLNKLDLHPLNGDGVQLRKYIILSGAKIYIKKGKRPVNVPSIDWEETYNSIRTVIETDTRFIKYIANLKKAKSSVFVENDKIEPLKVWESLIGKKRRLSKPSENDDSNRSKQRLEDSFVVDATTSTTDDEEDHKRRVIWTILNNKDLVEANGLSKSIIPILSANDHKGTPPIVKDGYIWLHGSTIAVFGKESNQIRPAVTKSVNWGSTLNAFIELVKSKGYDIKSVGTGEDNKAQRNLKQNSEILDKVLQKLTKSTEATSRVKQQSIEPYVSLKQLHDESEAAFQNYGEALKVYNEAKEAAKSSRSKASKSALKAATAAMRATKAIYLTKSKKYVEATKLNTGDRADLEGFSKAQDERNVRMLFHELPKGSGLKGRGLRGAGLSKPVYQTGIKRSGNGRYNLNDI